MFEGVPDDFRVFRGLVERATQILEDAGSSTRVVGRLVKLPSSGEMIVVGDLHGDLDSLRHILSETRFVERVGEGEDVFLVCLGDYVDRGPRQLEVLYTVLRLLERYPDRVFLLRGNHEGPRDISVSPADLVYRLWEQYGEDGKLVHGALQVLFDQLYTCAVIEEKALLVHGGIPSRTSSLEELAYAHQNHPEESRLVEMLWNDPSTSPGFTFSPRGIGRMFGLDVAERFLSDLGLKILIRGHQPVGEGYYFHDGLILSLFSSKVPPYGGGAAYLEVPLEESFTAENLRRFLHVF